MKKLIFWGATGQSIVLNELLSASDYKLIAVFDNNKNVKSPFTDIPIYYGWNAFKNWLKNEGNTELCFMVAIAGHYGQDRLDIHNCLKSEGLIPISAIHKSAYIASDANIGEGCQILANATVCARVDIGVATIINTAASIDHECVLGNGVLIAPGVHFAGLVEVGDNSFIGTGAVALPRIKIGSNTIIGAGAVVTKDIPDNATAYGNPARIIR